MAMFSSTGRDGARAPTLRPSGPDSRLSILAGGTKITGEVEVQGVIKIEGKIEGTVHAGGQVLVVHGGEVEGDIHTREAIIGGEVRGKIFAQDRVELQGSSVVDGDITTPRLAIEEGGQVNGNFHMTKPKAQPAKAPEVKKPSQEPPVTELRRTG